MENYRQRISQNAAGLEKNEQFLNALDETQYNSVLYDGFCTMGFVRWVSYDGLIGSIAMNLQSFYTDAERILLKIAREIDESVPRGEHWHKALLAQMAIDTDVRPVVLGKETFSALEELRSFRHFVRNAYSYTLDAQRRCTESYRHRQSSDTLS